MFEEKGPKTKTETETKKIEELLLAQEIARSGSFDLAEEGLKKKGFWENQKERVQKEFEQSIDPEDFPTKQEKLWELFTIQDLYDHGTALHSNETYKIAKDKIKRVLSKNVVLSRIIKTEGVELEDFYLACLTHDIGKIEIPNFIINNTTTKKQWGEKLHEIIKNKGLTPRALHKIGLDKDDLPAQEEILERIEEEGLHAEQLIPAAEGLSQEDSDELLNNWHFPADYSLMDILDNHAEASRRILEKKGLPLAADIVSQHHHKSEEVTLPASSDSLKISSNIADILHLADMEEALESKRSYKTSFTPLEALEILINDAEHGKIGKEITYLWVKDEIDKLGKNNLLKNLGFKERTTLNQVSAFIEEMETKENSAVVDSWIEENSHKKQEKMRLMQAA